MNSAYILLVALERDRRGWRRRMPSSPAQALSKRQQTPRVNNQIDPIIEILSLGIPSNAEVLSLDLSSHLIYLFIILLSSWQGPPTSRHYNNIDQDMEASAPRSASRPRPTSRPTTPLRPSSRSSFRDNHGYGGSVNGAGYTEPAINALEPQFAELADSMADLEANFMHLQLMHESLARFSESFASFLYGLNMNAFCVDFPEVRYLVDGCLNPHKTEG